MIKYLWTKIHNFLTSEFPKESACPYKQEPQGINYTHLEEDWLEELSVPYIAYTNSISEKDVLFAIRELGYDIDSNIPQIITLPRDKDKYPLLKY